ncbi:MAG: tetraacyldisaccharide 4'-kinase [Acidobacteria bacterium]|nr:MAG: tetraacyldisaccharide 4'-kinase [Acidobacteriota bacterium]
MGRAQRARAGRARQADRVRPVHAEFRGDRVRVRVEPGGHPGERRSRAHLDAGAAGGRFGRARAAGRSRARAGRSEPRRHAADDRGDRGLVADAERPRRGAAVPRGELRRVIASLYSAYRRAARADAHRLARPVVSIGNISMGGRGKTPLAAHVARLLAASGERPSILSRGYGREIASDGVTVVSDGQTILRGGRAEPARPNDLAHSGDEPLMLARAVPGAAVLVCDERALAGTLAERAFGCTVHVLDDGFQHHHLHRDVDIVIVADEDLSGRPVPFGRLREPVASLQFADAVILDVGPSFSSGGGAGAKAPAYASAAAPAYALKRSIAPAKDSRPVFALAGIAKPERFFDSLKTAGYNVVGTMGFADHHRYSASDIARIRDAAANAGASAIVTTSKDIVRLEAFAGGAMPFVEIPLDVSVEPADEFRAWLLARVAEALGAEASSDAKAASR